MVQTLQPVVRINRTDSLFGRLFKSGIPEVSGAFEKHPYIKIEPDYPANRMKDTK